MFIMSQTGEAIINAERVSSIYHEDNGHYICVSNISEPLKYKPIAIYGSEEEAVRALNKLFVAMTAGLKTFKMPQIEINEI